MQQDFNASVRATVSEILAAPDVPTVWRICCAALEGFGLHNIIYGATRIPTWGIIGDGRDALILYHGPQGYADIYLGEELFLHSPTYEWARHNTGFTSWAEAVAQHPMPPTPHQARIVQLNAKYACLSGFVGNLNDVVPGMRGVIGLSPGRGMLQPQADALWSQVGAEVEMLCKLMHLRIGSLPQTSQRRPLTSRQVETLAWCAQGKTMLDIATIMGISVAMVEKHLRLAREALDAQTTAHAVQKATSLNLLAV